MANLLVAAFILFVFFVFLFFHACFDCLELPWWEQFVIWATSWENLFLPYANNKSADQPAHPHSLISAFVVRCLGSLIPLVSISEVSSLYLASVAVQAGLCLTWSETPKTGFLVTRLLFQINNKMNNKIPVF